MNRPSLLPMLSAGAAIASAIVLLIELRSPDPVFPSPSAEVLPTPRSLQAERPPTLVTTELGSRPLFTPGRRPVMVEPPAPPSPTPVLSSPPPPPPPPPPPEAGTGLTLLGILNGPEGRIAIIRIKSSGDVERLMEGATVDRWLLQQILSDHVLLSIGSATQQLDFPPPTEGRSKAGGMRPASQPTPHAPPPRHP